MYPDSPSPGARLCLACKYCGTSTGWECRLWIQIAWFFTSSFTALDKLLNSAPGFLSVKWEWKQLWLPHWVVGRIKWANNACIVLLQSLIPIKNSVDVSYLQILINSITITAIIRQPFFCISHFYTIGIIVCTSWCIHSAPDTPFMFRLCCLGQQHH